MLQFFGIWFIVCQVEFWWTLLPIGERAALVRRHCGTLRVSVEYRCHKAMGGLFREANQIRCVGDALVEVGFGPVYLGLDLEYASMVIPVIVPDLVAAWSRLRGRRIGRALLLSVFEQFPELLRDR